MARTREFDEEQALQAAMVLFWRHGYEGTSLAALTEAMGVSKPSLYAAFGDKAQLFQRAVERYVTVPGAGIGAALELPTGRETVEALLRFYADAVGDPSREPGCLLVNGALRCSAEAEPIRDALAARRTEAVAMLRRRLERAQREGELGPDVSPAALAHYFWTVLHGMAVEGAGGASRKQLQAVAALALRAWPAPPPAAGQANPPQKFNVSRRKNR